MNFLFNGVPQEFLLEEFQPEQRGVQPKEQVPW